MKEHEREGKDEVRGAGGQPSFKESLKAWGPPPGKPSGTPNTDENLIEPGYEMSGDGSAEGGLNSQGDDRKSRKPKL